MSVVLASITGQTKAGSVTLGDSEVNFRWKPYAITLGMSMSLAAGEEEMIDVLGLVLESWDVIEVEDEDFPPTAENLRKVPVELASKIASAVVGGSDTGEAESDSASG
jgi:hypothetical protein